MILQALADYYEALQKEGLVTRPGLQMRPIYWAIVIDRDGNFIRIEDRRDGKTGQSFLAPEAKKRSGQRPPAQYLVDNRKYVLGCEKEGAFDKFRFEDFKAKVDEILSAFPESTGLRAISSFYSNSSGFEIAVAATNEIPNNEDITFFLEGKSSPICSDPEVLEWAQSQVSDTEGGEKGLCIVTGRRDVPLQNIHAKVNVPGTQANATLVSFQQNSGYDSYGKTQGSNAPISKMTSFAHTSTLNFLLRNEQSHVILGKILYLFWNSDAGNTAPDEIFREVAFGSASPKDRNKETDDDEGFKPKLRGKKSEKAAKDKEELLRHQHDVLDTFKSFIGSKSANPDWDSSHRFYILGLKGESGRIAVRFWRQGSVYEIFNNLYRHLQDFNIENPRGRYDEETPPLRNLFSILRSTFPANARNVTPPANLVQSFLESIINGTPYPLSLQQAIIGRLTHEGKVTELRAATLKACVNRKIRISNPYNFKELAMALDKENTNVAYLCGRLLAVLEQIQRTSLGKVNSTIIDRFYGSASTRPNSVFPLLISLSQHHLSKLRKEKTGYAINLDKKLGEIISLIDVRDTAFPSVFSLDEQSLFAVGYYHQKNAPWGMTTED